MGEGRFSLRIFRKHLLLLPLSVWMTASGVLGCLFGLGAYTFVYARGYSYASDNPKACINCHAMRDVYDGWNHSSHKSFAVCNDCHVPHSFPAKYVVKAVNGWHHSYAFTKGDFQDQIMIKDFSRKIVRDNCLHCHEGLVSQINMGCGDEDSDCLRCHRDVGHKH